MASVNSLNGVPAFSVIPDYKDKRNSGVIIFAAFQLPRICADKSKMTLTLELSAGLDVSPTSLTE